MKSKPGILIVVIALLAMAAKIYCAATTLGTTDILLFQGFGRFIAQNGLIKLYLKSELFNHPPLLGCYIGQVYRWAGEDTRLFAFLTRLPGILADFTVVLLALWIRARTGRPTWWALALLAASPVSFMISGYHGNYDPLIPLGLVLCVVACLQRQAWVAGLLLGLACQVKVIPLIMAPVLFFYWWEKGQGWRFAGATVVTLLAGWSVPLLFVPVTFAKQVLVYNSIWGWWGITYLLNISGLPGLGGIVLFHPVSPLQTVIIHLLKVIVVALVLVIAWRRRHSTAVGLLESMGLVWAVFFTFAPGFGVQYLVWVSPFLLFLSPRWFALYTGFASVALFVFYNTISGGMPWEKGFRLEQSSGIWAQWMLLPWVVFAALMIASWRKLGIGRGKTGAEIGAESEGTPVEVS